MSAKYKSNGLTPIGLLCPAQCSVLAVLTPLHSTPLHSTTTTAHRPLFFGHARAHTQTAPVNATYCTLPESDCTLLTPRRSERLDRSKLILAAKNTGCLAAAEGGSLTAALAVAIALAEQPGTTKLQPGYKRAQCDTTSFNRAQPAP